jgi:hypothetical protein
MKPTWEEILKDRLQLYGHRNWLVIADSAYPAQSSPGVETLVAHDEQTAVLTRVFTVLRGCRHIKPIIYTDAEMKFVPEEDAPGINAYRDQLAGLLKGREVLTLSHDEIISKLDRVGDKFRVLLIKTNMRIPYTSIFLELECGYWSARAENRLRAAMRPRKRRRNAARSKRRR